MDCRLSSLAYRPPESFRSKLIDRSAIVVSTFTSIPRSNHHYHRRLDQTQIEWLVELFALNGTLDTSGVAMKKRPIEISWFMSETSNKA